MEEEKKDWCEKESAEVEEPSPVITEDSDDILSRRERQGTQTMSHMVTPRFWRTARAAMAAFLTAGSRTRAWVMR